MCGLEFRSARKINNIKEEYTYENDFPAQDTAEKKGTRFPQENEDQKRPQHSQKQKSKREKETVRVMQTAVL